MGHPVGEVLISCFHVGQLVGRERGRTNLEVAVGDIGLARDGCGGCGCGTAGNSSSGQ
jgi:hypothetical protein